MIETTCCISGPKKISDEQKSRITAELKGQILAAVQDGYVRFITGPAVGCERIAVEIIAELKQQGLPLFLELALPYASRQLRINREIEKLYAVCNGVKILCSQYTPDCYFLRNRYMAAESSRVIVVENGQENRNALFTLRSAASLGKEVRIISI